jgi:predicted TIM-barrel fold metal-dependent hydrolase
VTLQTRPQTRSAEIRAKLDHPVIDCDGHLREFLPIYEEYLAQVGGSQFARTFIAGMYDANRPKARPSLAERRRWQTQQWAWWGVTTDDTDDYVTQIVPRRLHERLPDFGIDFCILYPTLGLVLSLQRDGDTRRAAMRALNAMHADLYNRPYGDRIHVPAVIPMHTPVEAIAELTHAVRTLGFKAALIPPGVARPIEGLEEKYPGLSEHAPDGVWLDRFGIDSAHDYDPVWAKFVELGVAVTAHGALMAPLPKLSRSISNYTFNHVRNQPSMMEQLCKALYMGGVTRRFPTLNFAFLEGGVAWACNLLSDIVGHWEKRNPAALAHLNPANLDREAAYRMLVQYGGPAYDRGSADATIAGVSHMIGDVPEEPDDFAAMRIQRKEELGTLFSRFYFGCEADDRMTKHAFDTKANRFGMKLKPLLSSDIGHFDVVDMEAVLEEAYENVGRDVISPADFRAQVGENPVRLHGGMNTRFFEGTAVADWAKRVLAQVAPAPAGSRPGRV